MRIGLWTESPIDRRKAPAPPVPFAYAHRCFSTEHLTETRQKTANVIFCRSDVTRDSRSTVQHENSLHVCVREHRRRFTLKNGAVSRSERGVLRRLLKQATKSGQNLVRIIE